MIKKPHFYTELLNGNTTSEPVITKTDFDLWLKDILKNSVKVNCARISDDWNCSEYTLPTDEWTHTALLIDIKLKKQETAEDILKRILMEAEETGDYVLTEQDFIDARRVLGGK